jgi:hypothetical protein
MGAKAHSVMSLAYYLETFSSIVFRLTTDQDALRLFQVNRDVYRMMERYTVKSTTITLHQIMLYAQQRPIILHLNMTSAPIKMTVLSCHEIEIMLKDYYSLLCHRFPRTLKQIHIKGFVFDLVGLHMVYLVTALRQIHALEEFHFLKPSSHIISPNLTEIISVLHEKHSQTLRSFHISDIIYIDSECAPALVRLAQDFPRLECLKLSRNYITCGTLNAICLALQRNTTISVLILNRCFLSNQDTQPLTELLVCNQTLKLLSLKGNNFSWRFEQNLQVAARKHSCKLLI